MGHIKGNVAYTPDELAYFLRTNGHLDGECVLWAGSFTKDGRPRVQWKRKYYSAQRLLLKLADPSFDDRLQVQTTCDHRDCMNPKHLTTRTRSQILKAYYTDHPKHGLPIALGKAKNARFGIDKAREAAALRASGMELGEIGARYGVTKSCVCTCMKNWERMGVI